jgi:hypothetical protein
MEAASVSPWRPIGQFLVERGFITEDELEQALEEQRTSGARLGEILISRGWVSGPDLAATVSEQLGLELETERGFGAGLFAEIRKRHAAGRGLVVVATEPEPAPPVEELELPPAEQHDPLSPEQELAELRARVVSLEDELEGERAWRVEAERTPKKLQPRKAR